MSNLLHGLPSSGALGQYGRSDPDRCFLGQQTDRYVFGEGYGNAMNYASCPSMASILAITLAWPTKENGPKRYMVIVPMAVMKELQAATGHKAEKPLRVYFQGFNNSFIGESVPFIEDLGNQVRGLQEEDALEDEPDEMAAYEGERSPAARTGLLAMLTNNAVIALGHQFLYAVLEQPRNFFRLPTGDQSSGTTNWFQWNSPWH